MPIHKMCLERYYPIFNSSDHNLTPTVQMSKKTSGVYNIEFQKHRPLELQRDGPLVTRKRKRKEKPFADKYDHK